MRRQFGDAPFEAAGGAEGAEAEGAVNMLRRAARAEGCLALGEEAGLGDFVLALQVGVPGERGGARFIGVGHLPEIVRIGLAAMLPDQDSRHQW